MNEPTLRVHPSTMPVSGIALLHAGGYQPGGRLGQITQVLFGQATDYALAIRIEQATRQIDVTFAHPLSFRVQDERDLMDYWFARDQEGVPVGLLYTVASSPYRDEFRSTISGQTEDFVHYLIAADDLCAEVLSRVAPQLSPQPKQ